MKKIFLLSALLCASLMAFAIDWSGYSWLGDGAGGGAYSNKYKVAPAEGQNVVNIQKPGWAAEPGIYTSNFGGTISSCTLGDKCAIDGGGIVLYLSAFTAQETEVTVVAAEGSKTFTVYYVDGTLAGSDYTITVNQPASGGTIAANKTEAKAGATVTLTATPADGKKLEAWIVKDGENADVTVTNNQFTMPSSNVTVTATFMDKPVLKPATFYGTDKFSVSETNYDVLWYITRNADATLTFAIEMTSTPVGFVPQINLGGNFSGLNSSGAGVWTYGPTTAEYEDDTTVSGYFYFAYQGGGPTSIDWTGYLVGASNSRPNPTAIDNVDASEKAVKVIENGQMVIIKNGVKYNVLGGQMK